MEDRLRNLEITTAFLHARVVALQNVMGMVIGREVGRDPRVLEMLKQMAAGDLHEIAMDDPPIPPEATEAQKNEYQARFAQHRKLVRNATMEIANFYAGMINRAHRRE